ncbi:MAG: hypothetical protein ACLFTG_10605, partial [Alphaproteobacteria bacterium]
MAPERLLFAAPARERGDDGELIAAGIIDPGEVIRVTLEKVVARAGVPPSAPATMPVRPAR